MKGLLKGECCLQPSAIFLLFQTCKSKQFTKTAHLCPLNTFILYFSEFCCWDLFLFLTNANKFPTKPSEFHLIPHKTKFMSSHLICPLPTTVIHPLATPTNHTSPGRELKIAYSTSWIFYVLPRLAPSTEISIIFSNGFTLFMCQK